MAQLSDEALEQIRRSIAMQAPTRPSSLSREQAIEIIEELQNCRRSWRRLTAALREVWCTAESAVGQPRQTGLDVSVRRNEEITGAQ